MEFLLMPWRHTFDYHGRARRTEYCLYLVQMAIAWALLLALTWALVAAFQSVAINLLMVIAIVALIVFSVASGVAVGIRRLHDFDQSGWLILIALIPYVGPVAILVFAFIGGRPGVNRFGTDPRGDRRTVEHVFS